MKNAMIVFVVLLFSSSVAAQMGKMLGGAADEVNRAAEAAGKAEAGMKAAEEKAAGAAAAKGGMEQAAEGKAAVESVAERARNEVPLTDVLVEDLDVTPKQAQGGAGAIFSLAKSRMEPDEFSQVSAGVPNMGGLLSAAPAIGGGRQGAAGAALGAVGGKGGKVGAAAQLTSAFSSLDMSSDMVSKFIPICVQYLSGSAGSGTAGLLQAALQ